MELRPSPEQVSDPRSNGEPYRTLIPANRVVIECDLTLPPLRRRDGALCLSRGMEDKWLVYLLAEHLYLARSWTGQLVMRVPVARTPSRLRIETIELDRAWIEEHEIAEASVPSFLWEILDHCVYFGIGTHAAPILEGIGGMSGVHFLGEHGAEAPRLLLQPRDPFPRMWPEETDGGVAELRLATNQHLHDIQQHLGPWTIEKERGSCIPYDGKKRTWPGLIPRPALKLRTRENVTFSIFRRGPFPELATGDILQAPVDCLVTTANPGFQLTGGIGAHLLRELGSRYIAVVNQAVRETFGERRAGRGDMLVTGGEGTRFRHILHVAAVGPRYEVDAASLEETTWRVLRKVDDLGMRSVALPALATGFGRVPFDVAAGAMRKGLEKALPELKVLDEVQIWVLSNPDMQQFIRGWTGVSY